MNIKRIFNRKYRKFVCRKPHHNSIKIKIECPFSETFDFLSIWIFVLAVICKSLIKKKEIKPKEKLPFHEHIYSWNEFYSNRMGNLYSNESLYFYWNAIINKNKEFLQFLWFYSTNYSFSFRFNTKIRDLSSSIQFYLIDLKIEIPE